MTTKDDSSPEIFHDAQESFPVVLSDNVKCLADLNDYEVTDISDLMSSVNKVLDDSVFVGRVVAGQTRNNNSMVFAVSDNNSERVIEILVNNCFNNLTQGSIVTIVNPCFKRIEDGQLILTYEDTKGEIMSHNAKYVVILTDKQTSTKFPDFEWSRASNNTRVTKTSPITDKETEIGIKYLNSGLYIKAIENFSETLTQKPYDEEILYHRSIAYFRLGQYKACVRDATTIINRNHHHLKAIYAVTNAYIELREYNQAKVLLESELRFHLGSTHDGIRRLLDKVETLKGQRDYGHYDMVKLYNSYRKSWFHDVADYVGPVKVEYIEGKGRGLVVTEDVDAGRLLLSCKPLAIIFKCFTIPLLKHGLEELLHVLSDNVRKEPALNIILYQLKASKFLGHLDTSPNQTISWDLQRVRGILRTNSFRDVNFREGSSVGLWYLPSFINNDCSSGVNCFNRLYGDVRQIRTFKPLKTGDEVLISYHEMGTPYPERYLEAKTLDFVCGCDLCMYEAEEAKEIREERERVLYLITTRKINDPECLLEEIVKVKELSKESPCLEYYIAMPLFCLGKLYFHEGQYPKAIEAYKEFLQVWERIGGDISQLLHDASWHVFLSYFRLGNFIECNKWKDVLITRTQLIFGSSDGYSMEGLFPGIANIFASLKEKEC